MRQCHVYQSGLLHQELDVEHAQSDPYARFSSNAIRQNEREIK
jgi:hypothetical protein